MRKLADSATAKMLLNETPVGAGVVLQIFGHGTTGPIK